MARPLIFSNSFLSVCLDRYGFVRDVFYPHVGLENHVAGNKHRIGVQADGQFSWLDSPDWDVSLKYLPETLVGKVTYKHKTWPLEIVMDNVVYNELPVFVRHVTVFNKNKQFSDVKIFFGQEFAIAETKFRNTGFYDPTKNCIIHYKGRRVFLVNGRVEENGFDQYTLGMFNYQGREGSWRDAEDGELSMNAVEHGPVDSVVRLCLNCAGKESVELDYWICAAETMEDVYRLNEVVINKTPKAICHSTGAYWKAWSNSHHSNISGLSKEAMDLYATSLLILRAHVDHDGGIIASPDSEMLVYGKDSYAYVWPRDSAYIAMALDKAGYSSVTNNFFLFCKEVLHPDGYLHHKFQTDKSLGSTWHSSATQHDWLNDRILQLPIQEDETATVLFSLWNHYVYSQNIELIEDLYKPMIEKMANFLVAFRDRETGLPIHSYDLWEEVTGVSTYTCATVYGALNAAANFSDLLGKVNHAENYRAVAQDIKRVLLQYLYDPERQSFVRYAQVEKGEVKRTPIIDASSLFGLWYYGVLDFNNSQFVSTQKAVEENLHLKESVGGFIRYEGDMYFRETSQPHSNPWIITTLWDIQRKVKTAASMPELQKAIQEIQWVLDRLGNLPVLAEQYDSVTGQPLSAMPLAWSHAAYVEVISEYQKRLHELKNDWDSRPSMANTSGVSL